MKTLNAIIAAAALALAPVSASAATIDPTAYGYALGDVLKNFGVSIISSSTSFTATGQFGKLTSDSTSPYAFEYGLYPNGTITNVGSPGQVALAQETGIFQVLIDVVEDQNGDPVHTYGNSPIDAILVTLTAKKFKLNGSFFFGTGTLEFQALTAISTVPLPAGLPLALSGLSLMGFFGWRKQRGRPSGMAPAI